MSAAVPFGPTGRVVFERTYSRTKEDGSKETWPETVARVAKGNLALVYGQPHVGWAPEVHEEYERLRHYMLNFALLPAGRHLWATGVEGRQYLFNCHVAGWGDQLSDHFEFSFLRLMEGGGVGANYSTKHIKKYGAPRRTVRLYLSAKKDHADYQELTPHLSPVIGPGVVFNNFVGDSREGWAAALVRLIDAHYSDTYKDNNVWFDLSDVRPSGSELKTFGGTASGPAPLAAMLCEVNRVLNTARVRGSLTPIDVMEIDHAIAECVVSGGNRRSARMSIVRWDDPYIREFLACKKDTGKHWTTNISVEIDDAFIKGLAWGFSKHNCPKEIHMSVVMGMLENGEPGYWNSSLSNEGEVNPVEATNPCGEIALEAWENCFDGSTPIITRDGVKTLRELAGEKTDIWFDGQWHEAQGRSFGVQLTQTVTFAPARLSTGSSYQRTRADYRRDVVVTPDHRWDTQRGLVNDLRPGDVVQSAGTDVEHDEAGIRHGVIYGDGSEHSYGKFRVRLYGAKQRYLSLFEHVTYPMKAGVPEGWVETLVALKELPAEHTSSEYKAGFLEGWMAMDGTVKPNGSVALGTTNEDAVLWLEHYAASLGWVVRGHFVHDGPTNYGERNAPLHIVTLAKDGVWVVEGITPATDREVFCVTVPGAGRFTLANGIETRNCNLGHVNMDWFAGRTITELEEAHQLMTRFLIRATYGDVNDQGQREKLALNRRIGVGHLGVQGFWAKNGVKYSDIPMRAPAQLRHLYSVVRTEARDYAFQLRIPEPVKVTAMAPTGSVSKLAGATESAQAIHSRYFEQRIRFSKRDEAQFATVMEAMSKGFTVEDDVYDASGMTAVVVYPTENLLLSQCRELGIPDDVVQSQDELTIRDMLRVQALYQQHWADNAVSYTVNVPEGKVWPPELAALLEEFLPVLKGTTIMVDASRPQAPYTRISKSEYEAAVATMQEDGIDMECSTGACPIR